MKILTTALAFAVLLTNSASATHYEISEHVTTHIVHVEVIRGHHEPSGKRK